MSALDTQTVVAYHEAQGHRPLPTSQVMAATGLSRGRVIRAYAALREVEDLTRRRVLVFVPGEGHRLIEGAVTNEDLSDIARWALTRLRFAQTSSRRARKMLDVGGVLGLESGLDRAIDLMRLAGAARAGESHAETSTHDVESTLAALAALR